MEDSGILLFNMPSPGVSALSLSVGYFPRFPRPSEADFSYYILVCD